MHLSLKGSLIRSPMLNRVGQRLLQLFEGASAAYSLRDLASNIASVVRVRRASDNSEKDFSAVDVSSGAMTSWVNSQIVPPLDIRELVDGERTGALVPAAAAYSLRNLSASYTGNVVDVRRSSDDAEDSFTAAEVADGTLTDWVNTNVDLIASPAVNSNNATRQFSSITNSTTSGFTGAFNDSDSTNNAGWLFSFPKGTTISYSFNAELNGATARFSTFGGSGMGLYNTIDGSVDEGSNTGTFTTSASVGGIGFQVENIPSSGSFVVSSFSITVTHADGFVSKWYDQSGNANHATQGTDASQPKIVDGGSLVSGGMDFDGVNDTLVVAGNPVITANYAGTYSAFSVQTVATNVSGYIAGNASPTNGSSLLARDTSDFTLSNRNNGNFDEISRAAGRNLLSACYNNGDASSLVNGGGSMVDSGTYDFSAGTSDFRIGSRNPSNIFLEGKIEEIIIYNTDQSDNRTAIEANIGETYGIDLPSGVDTGYDQVDGFVETWYDQSGNGNDAVQQVSGYQPKIVDAGVLVSGGIDFDGVDDFMQASIGTLTQPISGFSVFKNDSLLNAPIIWDSISSTNRVISYIVQSDGTFRINAGVPVLSASSSHVDGTTYLRSDLINTTASEGYVNGTLKISGNAGTNLMEGLTIGARYDGSINHVNGKIQEIIIYDTDQSANRPAIEANINNQYDIY